MKTLKPFFCIVLVFILSLSLFTACSSADKQKEDDKNNNITSDFPKNSDTLSNKELSEIASWINKEEIRKRFLLSTYESPVDIDMYNLFLTGAYDDTEVTSEDMHSFVKQYGWLSSLNISKLSESAIDNILKTYTGMSLDDTEKRHLNALYYVYEANSYFCVYGDIKSSDFEPIAGYKLDDTTVVYYNSSVFVQNRLTGIFKVTLRNTSDGYLFVSNVYVNTENSSFDYVVDIYTNNESDKAVSSDETISTAAFQSSSEFSSASIEEALTKLKGQDSAKMLTITTISDADISKYGSIYAFEVDKEIKIYYIKTDGSVYILPLPDGDFDDTNIVFSYGKTFFTYVIEMTSSDSTSSTSNTYTLFLPTDEVFLRTVSTD